MLNLTTVLILAVGYLVILFAVAWYGDKVAIRNRQRPWIYSLALGVHCSSWSFFGTTLQSYQYGWAFTPTYLGSVLLFAFGYPLLWQIIKICRRHNIASLADFISVRYDKSASLAAVVTLLALLGVVPYIALQLDAITTSINFVSDGSLTKISGGTGLAVTIAMAVFAILFGTRQVNLTEKNPGLMLAIAFESVVKLAAFIIVGLFICYGLFDGVVDLIAQASQQPISNNVTQREGAWLVYSGHILLGICSVFCLPRQFHINFVENNGEQELRTARWAFPLYLFAINLFVLPIAMAGSVIFGEGTVRADTFILALPMQAGNESMTLLGLVGGIASATSMVIVATLSVGIMVSNNLLTPLLLTRRQPQPSTQLNSAVLLRIRRITIVLVVAAAYLYFQRISQSAPLVNSGVIAMSLLAQLTPALLLGMFWSRASWLGALSSIITGILACAVLQLWPSIKGSYYFDPPPGDWQLTEGFLISLGLNTLVFVLISLLSSRKSISSFRQFHAKGGTVSALKAGTILELAEKFFTHPAQDEFARRLKGVDADDIAPAAVLADFEKSLTAVLGNTGAKLLLGSVAQDAPPVKGLVEMVEEVGQRYQFNLELLQSSIGHIDQGIAVVDSNLNLVAWNQRYIELFDFPDALIKAGVNVRELLQFNADRGLFGDGEDIQQAIDKRIAFLRQGSRYKFLRTYAHGTVIEINGNPMPGGGFVTTYTDITEYVETQRQLNAAKQDLEQRVEERTQQLQQANQQLQLAKQDAERANDSKTRFLAAAGHDLMQPFNAATLFAATLEQQTRNTELAESVHGMQQSLSSAEELLRMLLDISKLDTGVLRPVKTLFNLNEILQPLANEFTVIARQKGLTLKVVPCNVYVYSDKTLLRRIIQNLLSNAVRYTRSGKVLMGCRRNGKHLGIQVLDTGPGIPADQQQQIFTEFHQLDKEAGSQGLGLGLTIVDKISRLLGHAINLTSQLGNGTCFTVTIERYAPVLTQIKADVPSKPESHTPLAGKHVVVIDDDEQILQAMQSLLTEWGAQVVTISEHTDLQRHFAMQADLIIADYHLKHGENGVDWAISLLQHWPEPVPVILNSANHDEEIRARAIEHGFAFLHKPVKAGALKRLIRRELALES